MRGRDEAQSGRRIPELAFGRRQLVIVGVGIRQELGVVEHGRGEPQEPRIPAPVGQIEHVHREFPVADQPLQDALRGERGGFAFARRVVLQQFLQHDLVAREGRQLAVVAQKHDAVREPRGQDRFVRGGHARLVDQDHVELRPGLLEVLDRVVAQQTRQGPGEDDAGGFRAAAGPDFAVVAGRPHPMALHQRGVDVVAVAGAPKERQVHDPAAEIVDGRVGRCADQDPQPGALHPPHDLLQQICFPGPRRSLDQDHAVRTRARRFPCGPLRLVQMAVGRRGRARRRSEMHGRKPQQGPGRSERIRDAGFELHVELVQGVRVLFQRPLRHARRHAGLLELEIEFAVAPDAPDDLLAVGQVHVKRPDPFPAVIRGQHVVLVDRGVGRRRDRHDEFVVPGPEEFRLGQAQREVAFELCLKPRGTFDEFESLPDAPHGLGADGLAGVFEVGGSPVELAGVGPVQWQHQLIVQFVSGQVGQRALKTFVDLLRVKALERFHRGRRKETAEFVRVFVEFLQREFRVRDRPAVLAHHPRDLPQGVDLLRRAVSGQLDRLLFLPQRRSVFADADQVALLPVGRPHAQPRTLFRLVPAVNALGVRSSAAWKSEQSPVQREHAFLDRERLRPAQLLPQFVERPGCRMLRVPLVHAGAFHQITFDLVSFGGTHALYRSSWLFPRRRTTRGTFDG